MKGMRKSTTAFVVAGVAGSALLISATARATKNYGAECAENYASPCTGAPLPNSCDNVTTAGDDFAAIGWSRTLYYYDAAAWASDWKEYAMPAGYDNFYMDNPSRWLAIWSGHGTQNVNEPDYKFDISFGVQDLGTCFATTPTQLKYGEHSTEGWGNDSQNEYVLLDACCSLIPAEANKVWENWGPGIMMGNLQGFGFTSLTNDQSDRLEEFAQDLDAGDSNKSAWLDAGEHCILFYCENSPVVISYGETQSAANYTHAHESMKTSSSLLPRGWSGYYIISYVDNGGC